IKQAYRKLSKELHPDKHKGDKGKEAKFKEVNEAYEVLSDPKKKQAYDQFGSTDGSSPFGRGGGGFGGFSGQGFDPSQFSGGDFSDLFESFFGGGGGRRQRASDTRGRDVQAEVVIRFLDAVSGMEQMISMKANVVCSDCGGSGNESGSTLVTCADCGGTGAVQRTTNSLFGQIRQSVQCSRCKGTGKIPEKPCRKCDGEGRVMEKKTVSVHIPAGIDDGQTLRIKGEGEAGQRGSASGDLLVRVRVHQDKRFERDGDDIRGSLSVNFVDAVLGKDVTIETVHGPITMAIPAGTQPGQVLRIKGKGMPVVNSSRTGDHYVTVDIVVPTKLSREEKRLFEELRKT
ncbi:molecular chaperone DnaJ, partial [Candidatus Peribacteria bacterium]|nr:molecular chaperone DnaJ [Candidatus Peribacteria bacterium]